MSNPPDLLVLDLMLPQVDGLEICRAVRATTKIAGVTGDVQMVRTGVFAGSLVQVSGPQIAAGTTVVVAQ